MKNRFAQFLYNWAVWINPKLKPTIAPQLSHPYTFNSIPYQPQRFRASTVVNRYEKEKDGKYFEHSHGYLLHLFQKCITRDCLTYWVNTHYNGDTNIEAELIIMIPEPGTNNVIDTSLNYGN